MTQPESALKFQLFGTPGITLNEQPVAALPSAKVYALAYFLAATARTHSRDSLATLLYPDYDTAQAKKNLRGAIYHLRNVLGDFMEVNRNAVRLTVPLPAVAETAPDVWTAGTDAFRLEQLLRTEADATPERLIAAVDLYRGEFLEGFHLADAEPFEEWMLAQRERYADLVRQALNQLVVYTIENGRVLAGIDYARRLLALDPYHEETHRNLMLMLALDGQSSAALAQYDELAALLWDEFGGEPDEATEELADRIRAGTVSRNALQLQQRSRRHAYRLPADLTTFLDRVDERARILAALADEQTRLITLTGIGGIGKTKLAIQTAHIVANLLTQHRVPDQQDHPDAGPLPADLFRDGVAYVTLVGQEDDGHPATIIAGAVADALEIRLSGDDDPVAQILQALDSRRLLLVFDNFEQLLGGARFLTELLQRAPEVKAIVTSRARLNVRGETVIPLKGLPVPDGTDAVAVQTAPAAQLFIQTAATVQPAFEIDAGAAAAIARTCDLLQGLPLGIELAASWTRILSVDEIALELESSLSLLDTSGQNAAERHSSLRTVFDQSWRLLTETERQLFRGLSVFRGGFTRRAAQAVTGTSLGALAALSDKSLLRQSDKQTDSAASPTAAGGTGVRLETPEVLRQYAAQLLAESGEESRIAEAHARYYTGFLQGLEEQLRSGDQAAALDRIGLEIENIRAAVRWTTESGSQALVRTLVADGLPALFDYFDIRGWYREGEATFLQLAHRLSSTDATGNPAAGLEARAGWFAFLQGKSTEAKSLLKGALASAAAANDRPTRIFALHYLGALYRHTGPLEAAVPALVEARTLAEQAGDRYSESMALNTLAQVAAVRGDLDAAQQYCRRALAVKRSIGDRRGMIYSLTYLGRVEELQAHYEQARTFYAEALTISRELDDPRGIAISQQNLGTVALAMDQLGGAERLLEECLAAYRAIGSRGDIAITLTRLAQIAVKRGDLEEAALSVQEALQLTDTLQHGPARMTVLLGAVELLAAARKAEPAHGILAAVKASGSLTERQRLAVERLDATVGQAAYPTSTAKMTAQAAGDLAAEELALLTGAA